MSQINREQDHTVKRNNIRTPATEKSLPTANYLHYIQQITSFQPPQQCPQHFHDSITHICIDCDYKCVCATCLQEGSHQEHIVKNIQKGSKIADRILNEYLIRLRSQSDLLTLLKENVAIRKNELYSEYKQYEQIIENNFKILANDLLTQKQSLLVKLKKFHKAQDSKIDGLITKIKQQSEISLNMIDHLSHNIERLQATSLCIFFKDRKVDIQEILDEDRHKYEKLKTTIRDINWVIDCNIFDNLRQKISALTLHQSEFQIQLRDCEVRSESPKQKSVSKKKSLKKSGQISGGCITPKNYNSQKKISQFLKTGSQKLRKSTNSSKLLSMHCSPVEVGTPKQRSPAKKTQGSVIKNRLYLIKQEPASKFKKTKNRQ